MAPKWYQTGVRLCIIAVIALFGISLLQPWASLELDNVKFGPGTINGEMTLTEYGVDYDLRVALAGGGIIGGIGGIGGSFSGINESGSRVFVTGMGEFQERIGPIFDSYKDKRYVVPVRSVANPDQYAQVIIGTHMDTIPWWVVGMENSGEVWLQLNETSGDIGAVEVTSVSLELWTDYDMDKGTYKNHETVWEETTGRTMQAVGDRLSFPVEIALDEDYGNDNVGFVARVELRIRNTNGDEVSSYMPDPFGDSHPSTVNVRTMSQPEAARIGLAVLAFPLTLAVLGFGGVALTLTLRGGYKSKRWALRLGLLAMALAICAPIFYLLGVTTLVDLISFSPKVKDGFSWLAGFYLGIGALACALAGLVMMIVSRVHLSPPSEEVRTGTDADAGLDAGAHHTIVWDDSSE